jgi:hypothetical protein
MTDNLYSVVLLFDACDDAARTGVRTFLENRYRMTPEHMDKALDKGRLLIQRDRTLSDAQSIQQRIRIDGTVCQLKQQTQQPSNSSESLNGDSIASEASEPDRTIICPKCQTRQPVNSECLNCGVIYDRIHQQPAPRKNRTEMDETRENQSIAGEGARPLKAFAARRLPLFYALNNHLSHWRGEAVAWVRKPLNAVFSCCIMALTALLLETVLIFLVKYLWFIYTATSVGERFIALHSDAAEVLVYIAGVEAFLLAWEAVFLSLTVCLLIAYMTQLTHFSRFYLDTGVLLIKVVWIFSTALASAWIMWGKDPALTYVTTVLLVLPPTMLLLPVSLHLARATLPEMGAILSEIIRAVRRRDDIIAVLKKRYRVAERAKRNDATRRRSHAVGRKS